MKFTRLCIALFSLSAAFSADAVYPTSATKVTILYPRTSGFTINAGVQGFFFATDVTFTGGPCGTSNVFGIPYWDPNDSTKPNPNYRDYVNTIMLAFTLQKSVVLYLDGCMLGTTSRIVGVDLSN